MGQGSGTHGGCGHEWEAVRCMRQPSTRRRQPQAATAAAAAAAAGSGAAEPVQQVQQRQQQWRRALASTVSHCSTSWQTTRLLHWAGRQPCALRMCARAEAGRTTRSPAGLLRAALQAASPAPKHSPAPATQPPSSLSNRTGSRPRSRTSTIQLPAASQPQPHRAPSHRITSSFTRPPPLRITSASPWARPKKCSGSRLVAQGGKGAEAHG